MTLTLEQVKEKSAPMLDGLHEVVRLAAEQLVERCYKRGVCIRITQGLRTIAEQDGLYAQGRTKPGNIVTNSKGGYSFHNFGVAIDFVLIESGYDVKADKDNDGMADWYEVVAEAEALGFEWGGHWASFKDFPHFQMTFGLTTAQYRAGKKPTAAKIKAARAKIASGSKNEEDEAMTAAEKKAFEALQDTVSQLATSRDALKDRVSTLEAQASMSCPSWAKEAVAAAVAHKLMDTPDGASYDVYRLLTIIHRAGFIKN
ncbi:MAG: M15 family metallopeptidase [Bacillota bacterium]